MILTFTDFKESHLSAAGKTVPPKAKGSDGHDYALSSKSVDLVRAHLGSPLDVDTSVKSSADGKFTNYSVTAVRVPAAGPESPTTSTSTPTPSETAGKATTPAVSSYATSSDAARQRLIVRQTCLKAAVEFVSSNGFAPTQENFDRLTNPTLKLADTFVDWVFKEEAYGLTDPSDGGGAMVGVAPTSPAAQHLEAARQKMRDTRDGYALEDAVCPNCGTRETLHQGKAGNWFCAKSEGGCGWPPHGERADAPWTYGEWLANQPAAQLRRPDAPLVSPVTHPTRA